MTYGEVLVMVGAILMGGSIILGIAFSVYFSIRKKHLNRKLYEKYGL